MRVRHGRLRRTRPLSPARGLRQNDEGGPAGPPVLGAFGELRMARGARWMATLGGGLLGGVVGCACVAMLALPKVAMAQAHHASTASNGRTAASDPPVQPVII